MYTTDKEWTDVQNLRKTASYVMLDVTALDEISSEFEALEAETKVPKAQIRKRFEDILLNNSTLKNRVNGVILRYHSFSEKVVPKPGTSDQSQNQFQMLKQVLQSEVQLGVNVPSSEWEAYPNEAIRPFLKNIKIIAVSVSSEELEDLRYFERLREFVRKNLVTSAKKASELQLLHLHFDIEHAEELNFIQYELASREFPMEFISISTNLLTKLPTKTRVQSQYVRAIKRYLGCGYYNLFDYVESSKEIIARFGDPSDREPLNMIPAIDDVLLFLKEVENQFKKDRVYLGGIRVPACLLIPALRLFRNILETDCALHTSAERYAFGPMKRVFKGDFVGILKTPPESE